jgi:acrylyl-CoA reductase (NADPH)
MENKAFKALVVREGENKTFTQAIEEKKIDDLPPGDVIIQVLYSSVNYKDALSAAGNKGVSKNYPHTPGIDAAGIVAESKVPEFKVGDEVIVTGYDLGMNTAGGLEEYVRVPAGWVVRLLQGLSLRETMIYGTAGFTAGLSVMKLTETGLKPEDGEVLVTGATGGVGSIAMRIMAKIGYQVVAAAGLMSDEEFEEWEKSLKNLGASRVIPASEVDDTSGRLLLRQKWAGAIDTVGGNVLSTTVKEINYCGSVTTNGNIGGAELNLTVYPFILRGVTLIGIDSVECPMDTRLRVWNKLASDWKLDNLGDMVTEVPLAGVEEMIEKLLNKEAKGRTLVKISEG